MSIQIEDDAARVLRKAMLGRGIASRKLAEIAGIPFEKVRLLRKNRADAETKKRAAEALGMSAERLDALDTAYADSRRGNAGFEPAFPENLFRFVMPCPIRALPEMVACAYIAADFSRGNAVVFDCGKTAEKLIQFLRERTLVPTALCITHAHFDHAGGADKLQRAFPKMQIFSAETLFHGNAGTHFFEEISLNGLRVRAVAVPGHTPDSTVFVWENPPKPFPPIAFTGDALFRGSVGGCLPGDLKIALQNLQTRVFDAFPPETLVLPGHGPATTLANELSQNPFFA